MLITKRSVWKPHALALGWNTANVSIYQKNLDLFQEMWYYISTNWIGKQSPTSRRCPIQSNCLDRVGVGKSNNTTFGLYVEGYDPLFVCDEFCIRILEIV